MTRLYRGHVGSEPGLVTMVSLLVDKSRSRIGTSESEVRHK